jgi:hypothetical protein
MKMKKNSDKPTARDESREQGEIGKEVVPIKIRYRPGIKIVATQVATSPT